MEKPYFKPCHVEGGRALRRHHAERLKAKRAKYQTAWCQNMNQEAQNRIVGMMLHSATLCSCHMCGNPRKYFGERSLQELCAMQTALQEKGETNKAG